MANSTERDHLLWKSQFEEEGRGRRGGVTADMGEQPGACSVFKNTVALNKPPGKIMHQNKCAEMSPHCLQILQSSDMYSTEGLHREMD